jgi:hypothetical protein
MIINLNQVEPGSRGLIPDGVTAKVVFNIKSGGAGDEGLLTTSKSSNLYINGILIITEGEYYGRKIYDTIVVESPAPSFFAVTKGLQKLRAMMESAFNITPTDMSDDAVKIRQFERYSDLSGLEFLIKVGIEVSKDQRYRDKNCVKYVITPDDPEYSQYFSGNGGLPKPSVKRSSAPNMDDIPF